MMGHPRTILFCLFGAALCLTESHALQCYSFQHTYLGPFDLSGKQLSTVSCPDQCFEAVSSLSTGYRASLTLVKKGCWTGPAHGQMEENKQALPPDFSLVRGCNTSLCNSAITNHDAIPDLSPVPSPPKLSGTECYACVGHLAEDCSPQKSRRVQCYNKETVCFQGNGRMTLANFSVPVYIRTCHEPSCIVMGTSSPWSDINLQGSCCQGSLCNQKSVFTAYTAAAAPPQTPRFVVLLLMLPLLVSALGGPLGLSL